MMRLKVVSDCKSVVLGSVALPKTNYKGAKNPTVRRFRRFVASVELGVVV